MPSSVKYVRGDLYVVVIYWCTPKTKRRKHSAGEIISSSFGLKKFSWNTKASEKEKKAADRKSKVVCVLYTSEMCFILQNVNAINIDWTRSIWNRISWFSSMRSRREETSWIIEMPLEWACSRECIQPQRPIRPSLLCTYTLSQIWIHSKLIG